MFLGKPKTHIMLSLDDPSREKIFRTLDACRDVVDAIKFNYPPVLENGLRLIQDVRARFDFPVVADFKVADVPFTNNQIAKMALAVGANAIMVHGFIGSDALMEIQEQTQHKLGVIVVTELTHPGGIEFTRTTADTFAELASMLDCYGIQAPGNRPDRIRELRRRISPEMVVVSCGVGVQGGRLKDAVEAGADFGIVGRAITQSDDQAEAARRIARMEPS